MKTSALKKKLYTIIFQSDTKAGRRFDLVLLLLIILSILSVCLESMTAFRRNYYTYIHWAEWVFTILFTLEYLLRIYAHPKPLAYIFSFYGLIDFLACAPTYLSLFFFGAQYLIVVRSLRLLRVFRILKLNRFITEGNILRNALIASTHKITVFLISVLSLVTIIGTLMYLIEGNASGFTSIPKSIYWAIVTITTVGYGDLSPQSPLGQFLASILMIIGYGIIAVPTGIVSVEMAKATDEAKYKCPFCHSPLQNGKANFCSNCGQAQEKK